MDQKKNELYHHGVKGMKWGISKYGSVSVSTNYRPGHKTYDLRSGEKARRKAAKITARQANKDSVMAEHLTYKSQKLKAKGRVVEAKHNAALGKKFAESAKINNRRVDQLQSGKLKAGRDYVINHKISTNIPLTVFGILNVSTSSSVEYRKGV